MLEITSFDQLKVNSNIIIIFGAGKFGIHFCEQLLEHNIPKDQIKFCDNFKSGYEKNTSIEIISFNELCYQKSDPYIFLTIESKIKRDEVLKQINDQNLKATVIDYPEIVQLIKKETNGGLSWKDVEKTYDWSSYRKTLDEILNWIDEDDRSVIDYSAGEAYLQTLLPHDKIYIATDYIARKPWFIKFDYNTDEFPDINADVSVLNQMLYYVNDLKTFLENVCIRTAKKIIIGISIRLEYSFINYIAPVSPEIIINIIHDNGFSLSEKKIKDVGDGSVSKECLLLFERE